MSDGFSLTEVGWSQPVRRIARGKAVSQHEALARRAQAARDNPEEAKQAYDGARRSLLGEFAGQPVADCQPCMASRKAESRRQRRELIDKAIVSCPSCATEAVRLRQDMDEVENMRCARHVYTANDPDAPPELRDNPPPGFLKPTEEDYAEMGITPDMLQPKGTSFRAGLYMKDPAVWAPPDPPDPKGIVAFRGSTPAMEDWENNMMQGINSDPGFVPDGQTTPNEPYYRRAVEIGAAARKSGGSLQFVGHSLGGGLASAAQGGSGGANGLPTSTYNSAGLNSATVAKFAENGAAADPAMIRAIRLKGEVLTKTQETGMASYVAPKAVGIKRDLEPVHDKAYYLAHEGAFDRAAAAKAGASFDENESYSTYLHGMDEVIASMEAQKEADQKKLDACVNRKRPAAG
ncbi:hypothetical protein [Azospirillum sp. TSO35-2]|uniref:hypothetical protein n=1 Tax=Azospirillum sp. TSO35-2 TaxID=716796 RepID=UPI000D61EAC4|nr:hypothetical protein [Azospirillum sp. TSO35-2]PWC33630.1 hypothetical protein TSO352_24785 [Azospirillum sp. TSO35-2]